MKLNDLGGLIAPAAYGADPTTLRGVYRATAGAFGIAPPVPRLRRGSLAQRDGDAAARLPMRRFRSPLRPRFARPSLCLFGSQGEGAGGMVALLVL